MFTLFTLRRQAAFILPRTMGQPSRLLGGVWCLLVEIPAPAPAALPPPAPVGRLRHCPVSGNPGHTCVPGKEWEDHAAPMQVNAQLPLAAALQLVEVVLWRWWRWWRCWALLSRGAELWVSGSVTTDGAGTRVTGGWRS